MVIGDCCKFFFVVIILDLEKVEVWVKDNGIFVEGLNENAQLLEVIQGCVD